MGERLKKYGFLLIYLLVGIHIIGLVEKGPWLFSIPIFVFIIIPLLDLIVGEDRTNPDDMALKQLNQDRFFTWILLLYVPIQLFLLAGSIWIGIQTDLSWWERTGLVLSLGIMTGGLGITIAHELGHKTHFMEQVAAKILLSSVCYTHFFIEHNLGHHANVSTPQDPASARFGESIFHFLPRTVIGSYLDAWSIESRKFNRKGKMPLGLRNRMIWYSLIPFAICGGLYFLFGPLAMVLFLGQSVVAVLLLEIVNYIEHYGLRRKELAPGKFEPVDITHSWNANHLVTNWFLLQLQRHSDHHAHATRRYQSLRHFNASPQLPTGYAGMILIALVPPIWFRMMDPKVRSFYQ